MKKQTLLFTLALVVLTFIGCKPPKEFIDNIKVTPNPAEYKAGQVKVDFEGNFPDKYFTKNMTMEVVPVLTTADGKAYRAAAAKYQGEKVQGNDDVIKYKVGGKYRHSATWDYVDGMESSVITLEATVQVGTKEPYKLDPIEVAKGVNITPLLVSMTPGSGDLTAVITPDKFERIIEEKTDAQIKFLVNQAQIRNSEVKADEVVALTKAIQEAKQAENREVKGISIASYASPEGDLDFNTTLSANRGKSSEKYLNEQLKKYKAEAAIDSKSTAEDWEGFQTLVENSSIEDKALILRVLSMYSDPEQREKEIRNIAAAYKVIDETILPELRRSKLQLTINVIGKSDEEITRLATEAPAELNVEELLYAATLTENMAAKEAIYTKATELFAKDARTFNNLGMVQYEQGKVDAAARAFAKALTLDANNAAINYNNGLIALAQGNVEKAEEFFGKAGGVGEGLNLANGAIAITKGDYKKAAELYGNTASNNAALANILNKNNGAARKALDNVATPNATTSYLKAVVAARTNNKDEYNTAIVEAQKDATLNARSQKDIEFENMK